MCKGFVAQTIAAAEKSSIKEGKDSAGWMGIVHRCAEYKTICFMCFFYKLVDGVIFKNTFDSITHHTSITVADPAWTDLNDFILYIFFGEDFSNFLEGCKGAAFLI